MIRSGIFFTLFFLMLMFSTTTNVWAQKTKNNHQIDLHFDIHETLKKAPLLKILFQPSWQYFNHDSVAYRFTGTIDIRTIFRFELDSTRFYENKNNVDLESLESLRAAMHFPFRQFSLIYGFSWTSFEGKTERNGATSYLSTRITPHPHLSFDLAFEQFLSLKKFENVTDVGISIGRGRFYLKTGYRWIHINGVTLNGPNVGMMIQF